MIIIVLLLGSIAVHAQENWEMYLSEFYENNEEADMSMEEAYDVLTELAEQPLDINTAEEDELLQIAGLSLNVINDIIEYREKYGNIKDMTELLMIPSIDSQMYQYLCNFLCVRDKEKKRWWTKEQLKEELRHLKQNVITTASIPTYYRAGDRGATAETALGTNKYANTYLGYPIKHSLKYSAALGSNAKLNFMGGNSAAEPFFTYGNKGYDAYAYNLVVNKLGMFRRIIVGTFRGQFGMGLTLNNNFSMGKQAILSSVGRLTNVFSAHSSASDSKHLQGIATTIDYKKFQLSVFFSYRYIDATLNSDSITISSILTSGYHRTAKEMKKKNNSAQLTSGAHLKYSGTLDNGVRWSTGASFLYTALNRDINPTYSKSDTISTSKLYRLYYARGRQFYNASVDYMLRWNNIIVAGETAVNDKAALATINTATWRLPTSLTLMLVQRYYSYKYYSLYGSSFSDGGSVQNESGVYLAAHWARWSHLTLDVYSDVAYFPWLKYRVSGSSMSFDNSVTLTYARKKWSLLMRYRIRSKQRDKTITDGEVTFKQLCYRTNQRLRLLHVYKNDLWNVRSLVEGCMLSFDGNSNGMIVSESVGRNIGKRWMVYAHVAGFYTDDYDSRMYDYERGMLYSFGSSSYYGRGMRLSLMAQAVVTKWLTAMLKVGHTRYFDRSTIGTAERQIFSNNQTDIDMQIRCKF